MALLKVFKFFDIKVLTDICNRETKPFCVPLESALKFIKKKIKYTRFLIQE